MNNVARDAVGTGCDLAKYDGFDGPSKNVVTVFLLFPRQVKHCIHLKLSHVTFLVSFFLILLINQYYIVKR